MLSRWTQKLTAEGHPIALELLSIDDSDQIVADFQKAHAIAGSSARINDPTSVLPGWLRLLGLDEGAPIPVHILVDPASKIRCARAGAVDEADYAVVAKILAE